MQNTIQLPQDLYDALRKKAAAQQKTTDALVIEWVSEHLEETPKDDVIEAFEKEIAAFEQMKPSLLTQYAGQYVAIYQGRVVTHGNEKLPLLDQVRAQFGNVVCYVGQVTTDAPRTVRMPSFRIARS